MAPVDGFNHSTVKVLEPDIAERFSVNSPRGGVNQVLRADGWGLGKTIPCRRQRAPWSHVGKIQLAGISQDVAEIIPEIVPSPVRTTTDGTGWSDTQVPILARVIHHVRVHEEHLVAGEKVFPRIIAIL